MTEPRQKILPIKRAISRGILLCLLSFICWPASALDLANQTLRYAVDYQGTSAGDIEVFITRTESGYQVRSVSHLSLVATIFLQSFTIESDFEHVDGELRLSRGKEILNETGTVHRSYTVDYENRVIRFSDGEPQKFEAGSWLDADAFPLALVFADLSSLSGKKILSISAKRARQYLLDKPVQESVTVLAGTFDSNKIVYTRQDDPTRTVRVWLRQDENPVPLRITSGKPGKETTMELTP